MSDISSGPFSAHKRPPYKALKLTQGDLSPKRPKLVRGETDQLLSYYESSIPNEANHGRTASPEKAPHTRKQSTTSSSSSDYSDDSEVTDARDAGSETVASVRRRSSLPSKGGADRRRVAIVEMDTLSEGGHGAPTPPDDTASNTGSIRQRRGHKADLAGLALVAPPDAALRTYTHLTPPPTAPLAATAHQQQDKASSHHRSASEIAHHPSKKIPASRDTTMPIVGSMQGTQTANSDRRTRDNKNSNGHGRYSPASGSSSPHSTNSDRMAYGRSLLSPPDSGLYPSMSKIDLFSPIVTPDIGEGKEIHVPVAAPVVVDLEMMQAKRLGQFQLARAESPGAGSTASHSSVTSSYLHYQPGVHATAGPLPPPPRAMFNIDISSPPPPRPPRLHSPTPTRTRGDIDAVKQALQLPAYVTAALASKSPQINVVEVLDVSKMDTDDDKSSFGESSHGGSKLAKSQSIHRREGATLSSSVDSASMSSASSIPRSSSPESSVPRSSVEDASPKRVEGLPQLTTSESFETPLVTVVEPPTPSRPSKTTSEDKLDHTKFDQWLRENPHLTEPVEVTRDSLDEPRRESPERSPRSMSPLSMEHTGEAPSPPPKSFRISLSTNLKRLSSLPRTPSLSPKSNRRQSGGSHLSSRTPSPSLHIPGQPLSPFHKTRSMNPAALYCHEVYSQNTTLQRCAIYASKINELYLYDCGLSDWVEEMKGRSLNSQTARVPVSTPFTPQPRHTSRSSIISEATFPRRPDASTATDLSQGAYHDITPSGLPPSLPYPSLALNPPRSAPARSNTSISSATPPSSMRSLAPSVSTSSKGTGFFASLGRKASLSKKDRPIISSPGPASAGVVGPPGRLGGGGAKTGALTKTISKPITITSPPTVPGGPRAPPHRAQRSQTLMFSVSPTSSLERGRESHLGRRPSMFNMPSDHVIDIQADPEFAQQVDKLKALIPHADRDVLAGYLRRAGQDLLAIGQYLEDERMGTIRQS